MRQRVPSQFDSGEGIGPQRLPVRLYGWRREASTLKSFPKLRTWVRFPSPAP